MQNRTYYVYLFLVSFVCLLLNYLLLNRVDAFQGYENSGLWGIISFSLVSLLIFHRAGKLFKKDDKSSFISWIMAGTLLKMILSVVILIVFAIIYKPADNYFIAPFFIYYFIFFIFETTILMKITKR